MKKAVFSLALAGVAAAPAFAHAREVTLTSTLQSYRGNGAYVAIYLTDAQGKYERTLWVAGKKAKYYKHLRDWARGSGLNAAEFDGVSGASVGSGETLKVSVDIADALIDAGYQIRIDTAVEDKRENSAEVQVPLTCEGSGKATSGNGYVDSFRYDL